MKVTLFGREPALWIQMLQAVLALVVAFPASGLSDTLAASIVAVVAAGFTAWQALLVRPIAPTVFSGVLATLAPLVAHFGLEFTAQQVGLTQAAVAAVVALLVRQQSTPVYDPAGDVVAPTKTS